MIASVVNAGHHNRAHKPLTMSIHQLLMLCCIYVKAAGAVSVTVPTSVPQNASAPGNEQFLGMGIEAVSFPQYTGNKTNPNTFSLNMFSSLTSRLTTLPIRLGGTSLYVASDCAIDTWSDIRQRL